MAKKKWSEMTPREQGMVLGLVAVQAVVVTFAQRDLSAREPAEVRGPKPVWRLICLNLAGAIAYIVVGRRPAQA